MQRPHDAVAVAIRHGEEEAKLNPRFLLLPEFKTTTERTRLHIQATKISFLCQVARLEHPQGQGEELSHLKGTGRERVSPLATGQGAVGPPLGPW